MILLSLLFVIQFSVSVAVLAFNHAQQYTVLWDGWCGLNDADKNSIQHKFECYGGQFQHPSDFRT